MSEPFDFHIAAEDPGFSLEDFTLMLAYLNAEDDPEESPPRE
jgi:hypothetical protein